MINAPFTTCFCFAVKIRMASKFTMQKNIVESTFLKLFTYFIPVNSFGKHSVTRTFITF